MKRLVIGGAVLFAILSVSDVQATQLWTMASGSDNAGCGSRTSPCRSISQAIENAQDGDTIYVGPGRYGDVDGDGSFSGPGDERPQSNVAQWDNSGCIVCINKGVHIYSTSGAALTVIDAGGSQFQSTVLISSDGVDFGADQQGFTLSGGNSHGITIEPNYSPQGVQRNISVAGNIDIGDGDGVYMFGDNYDGASYIGCPPRACTFNARVLIANNRFLNNGNGVNVAVNNWKVGPGYVVIRDNQAFHAGTGYFVFPGSAFGLLGVAPAGNVQLINNIAATSNVGFYVIETGPIEYNTAIGNVQSGFVVTPGGAPFSANAALGNGGPGVLINLSPDPFDLGNTLTCQSFAYNTFVDNDRRRPPQLVLGYAGSGNFNAGPSAHCGVLNLGPLGELGGPSAVTPLPVTQLLAAHNYWGSADGPSSNGPGDAAGGACDQNNATTVALPFLSTAPPSTKPPDP